MELKLYYDEMKLHKTNKAVSYLSNHMDSNTNKGKGKILVSEKDIAAASFCTNTYRWQALFYLW